MTVGTSPLKNFSCCSGREFLEQHGTGNFRFLVFGPSGSGGKLHAENGLPFFDVLIHGYRRWLLLEEGELQKVGMIESARRRTVCSALRRADSSVQAMAAVGGGGIAKGLFAGFSQEEELQSRKGWVSLPLTKKCNFFEILSGVRRLLWFVAVLCCREILKEVMLKKHTTSLASLVVVAHGHLQLSRDIVENLAFQFFDLGPAVLDKNVSFSGSGFLVCEWYRQRVL